MTIEELLDIETIKNLRIWGAQYLDSQRLEDLAELYTEDALCEFGPYGTWEGKAVMREKFAEAEGPFYQNGYFSNMHVITNHAVKLTGPDTASGYVYLVDFDTNENLEKTGNPLFWLGGYDEEYRRVGDDWRIARQSLSFVWPERHLCAGFPPHHTEGSGF